MTVEVRQAPGIRLHPAQRRYLAEDLVRLRRSGARRRYSAPQRGAKIDANPHQVDAVIFALARLREGGCILADEVGLGKTIEAGLVIAQLMAEGARRILLITPKALLGQWRQELYQLFSIDAIEAEASIGAFDGAGVFLIGREAAGSVKGRDALRLAEAFDLCVIDEAHEVFAGIYKRFDKFGLYKDDSNEAQTAGRLREVLNASHTPVLLLTATPMQNNLAELWGLVQYVDPLGTLLGDLATFRETFCGVDDRQVAEGQEEELRNRLRIVLQRTLRRDAQDFLEKPFVGREARLFEYTMSPRERALYDDVTQYLLEPSIFAFQGRHRQLLLLGFHRRMASSTRALAASLERVAARLRRMLTTNETAAADVEETRSLLADLEEDIDEPVDFVSNEVDVNRHHDSVTRELRRVEGYIERAHTVAPDDSKFRALLQALRFVKERAGGDGRLVIFTESLVTQNYLRESLTASRLVADEEITLFSGTNDSPRATEALHRWLEEVSQSDGAKMNRAIATRLALVHEFRTRTRVFISTEAGAKGLNLQFCDTLVNYDLPWNPQRIEQRIGRCHRYGQQRGVTVINFLAKDNLAQALTFEILSQKLELFGTVLDASDQVLHRPSGNVRGEVLVSVLGNDFEGELRRIYERARTLEEVTAELQSLREKVAEERKRFEEGHARAADLIEKRLEDGVKSVFRKYQERIPDALAELDRDLVAVVTSYLDASAIPYTREAVTNEELLHVGASAALPVDLQNGVTAAIGRSTHHASLYLNHELVRAAVASSRSLPTRMSAVISLSPDAPAELQQLRGRRGRLRLTKLAFEGFERVELLVPVLLLEGGHVLTPEACEKLLKQPMREPDEPIGTAIGDDEFQDASDEVLFSIQAQVDVEEEARFQRAVQQADRFIDDRLLVLRRRRQALETKIEDARLRREGAAGSDARTSADKAILAVETTLLEVEAAISQLENRDDETFQRYRDHIHRRRYTPPRAEVMFDLDLELE